MKPIVIPLLCINLGVVAAVELLAADVPTAISRRALLTAELAPGKAVSRVEIQEVALGPKQNAPRHLHPCPVVGVITEGSITFEVEGQPAQHLQTGDAFYEPAETPIAHFDNEGAEPAKFVAFYLLGRDGRELIRLLKGDAARTQPAVR